MRMKKKMMYRKLLPYTLIFVLMMTTFPMQVNAHGHDSFPVVPSGNVASIHRRQPAWNLLARDLPLHTVVGPARRSHLLCHERAVAQSGDLGFHARPSRTVQHADGNLVAPGERESQGCVTWPAPRAADIWRDSNCRLYPRIRAVCVSRSFL